MLKRPSIGDENRLGSGEYWLLNAAVEWMLAIIMLNDPISFLAVMLFPLCVFISA